MKMHTEARLEQFDLALQALLAAEPRQPPRRPMQALKRLVSCYILNSCWRLSSKG